MIKLCIDKYAIFLIENDNTEILSTLDFKRAVVYKGRRFSKLVEIIDTIETQTIKYHFFFCKNPKDKLRRLKKTYIPVIAGGGLVTNEDKDILFIYRNKKWDLPKGKAEKKETKKQTAVREVEEECGLTIEKCENLLLTTCHFYIRNKKKYIKTTYWYKMISSKKYNLTPQLDENIEKVEWKKVTDIPELMKNSYSSIEDVLSTYING